MSLKNRLSPFRKLPFLLSLLVLAAAVKAPSAQQSALPQLFETAPAAAAAVPAADPGSVRVVPVGSGLLPVIEDAGRVKSLLRLIDLIAAGGPFPFREDGTVFKNKEGRLPEKPLGFYREYTLLVPKDSSRRLVIGGVVYNLPPSYGARGCERLVTGGDELVYYSPTHYQDFIRLTVLP